MKILNKIDRNSREYKLAEKIVFLTEALKRSNKILNEDEKLGVLPNHSISFKESKKHHKEVRKIIIETI
jgi:hypothetical protein